MATTTQTSTPQSSHLTAQPEATPSPGSWQHPRAAEISRRTRANTFNESNLHRVVYNGGALAFLGWLWMHPPFHPPTSLTPLTTPLTLLLSLLLTYNILHASLPLLRAPDELNDIPLTPTQRALLGLPPSSSHTPGGTYITPPRYALSRSASGSGKASPVLTDRGDSPVNSPLWVKTRQRERERRGSGASGRRDSAASGLGRRGSGGGGNGLAGFGGNGSVFGGGSPGLQVAMRRESPLAQGGRSSSVGISSKWIYERDRRGSGGYS